MSIFLVYKRIIIHSLITIIIFFSGLSFQGCTKSEKPPYITASIIDIYNRKTIIENLKLFYWWEERGETPFLKPYTHSTKTYVFETLRPVENNPRRVTKKTEQIPLHEIDFITIVPTSYKKIITVHLKNGNKIEATDNFPQVFRKGEKTGIADFKYFLEGIISEGEEKKEFKMEFDKIRKIEIVEVDMGTDTQN